MLAFDGNAERMTDDEFAGAALIVGDLALLAISGSLTTICSSQSVRARELARVKAAVRRRLTDPNPTLNDPARDCGLPLRFVSSGRQNGESACL
jgi:hypothetical protein